MKFKPQVSQELQRVDPSLEGAAFPAEKSSSPSHDIQELPGVHRPGERKPVRPGRDRLPENLRTLGRFFRSRLEEERKENKSRQEQASGSTSLPAPLRRHRILQAGSAAHKSS